jgi:hypothetical protein
VYCPCGQAHLQCDDCAHATRLETDRPR